MVTLGTQEEELTQEEIEKIESKVSKLIKKAERKDFCHKAMEIVITLRGKPLSKENTESIQENELLVTLKNYRRVLFEEPFTHDVSVCYKKDLVYRCQKEYGLSFHEIITYSPGEWEKQLFNLYNKLPEYKKRMKEEGRQKRARELKSRFRLSV